MYLLMYSLCLLCHVFPEELHRTMHLQSVFQLQYGAAEDSGREQNRYGQKFDHVLSGAGVDGVICVLLEVVSVDFSSPLGVEANIRPLSFA